jgi:hypothetical protein
MHLYTLTTESGIEVKTRIGVHSFPLSVLLRASAAALSVQLYELGNETVVIRKNVGYLGV